MLLRFFVFSLLPSVISITCHGYVHAPEAGKDVNFFPRTCTGHCITITLQAKEIQPWFLGGCFPSPDCPEGPISASRGQVLVLVPDLKIPEGIETFDGMVDCCDVDYCNKKPGNGTMPSILLFGHKEDGHLHEEHV